MSGDPVVVVPGDLDVEDRIAGPVTFRMAAWLAAAAGGAALVATADGEVATVALGVLLVLAGVAGAWLRPGGRPVTAWVMPLLAYRRRRRSFQPTAAEAPVPETDAAVEEPAADAVGRPRRRPLGRLVVAVAGVAVVAAGAAVSIEDRGPEPAAPVVGVEVRDPAPGPVVVVVPVDPFGGWEVGGDGVDPLCGC